MQSTENQNRAAPSAATHRLPSSLKTFFACFSRRQSTSPSPSPPKMALNMHHSNLPPQPQEQQGRKACVAAAPAGSSMGRSQDLDADPESLPVSSNLDATLAARKQRVVDAMDSKGSAAAFPVVLSEGEGKGYRWVVGETQGRRKNMEDAHVVHLDIDGHGTALFAVFDGHSGREVSAFCAQHFVEELLAAPSFRQGDVGGGLRDAFLALDRRMADQDSRAELAAYAKGSETAGAQADHHTARMYGRVDEAGRYLGPKAGSTAAVAVVQGDRLFVAHAGDSRVVLSEDGVAQALTTDHKPDTPQEKERIYSAGQFVMQRPGGVPRIGGSLAMSRAMGDAKYKDPNLPPEQQAVTAAPDVTVARLAAESGGGGGGTHGSGGPAVRGGDPAAALHPRLLVVACDGLWDVMSRQQVVNFLEQQLATHGSAAGAAAPPTAVQPAASPLRAAVGALMHEALRPDSATPPSTDNVTAIVVQMDG